MYERGASDRRAPIEERQVRKFIEGLRSRMLRKDLYMRGCHTLEEVTKVAIDLVDNCNIYEEGSNADIY